jgi:hypothetical protein
MLWAVFLGSALVLGCWRVVVRFLQSEHKKVASLSSVLAKAFFLHGAVLS